MKSPGMARVGGLVLILGAVLVFLGSARERGRVASASAGPPADTRTAADTMAAVTEPAAVEPAGGPSASAPPADSGPSAPDFRADAPALPAPERPDPGLFAEEGRRAFLRAVPAEDRARLVELKARPVVVRRPAASDWGPDGAPAELYVMFAPDGAPAARAALEARGARTLDHLSRFTWRMLVPKPAAFDGLAGIMGVERVRPEDKMTPELWQQGQAAPAAALPLVALLNEGATAPEGSNLFQALGLALDELQPDGGLRAAFRGTFADARRLAAQPDVRHVRVAPPPLKTMNAVAAALSGVDQVQAAPYGLNGSGVRVAIRDGGAVATHPDFGARMTVVEAEPISDHATHVAGTVAGSGLSNAAAKGMAPAATFYTYTFGDGSFDGEMESAWSAYGIRLSTHSYGHIIGWDLNGTNWTFNNNQSMFGDYSSDSESWDARIRARDLIATKSAGNDRNDMGTGPQPADGTTDGDGQYDCVEDQACAKNAITVGAVDAAAAMSSFSGWGPADDGRIKPDLVADGVDLLSTGTSNDYATKSGTSMATPATCGSLALLMQEYKARNSGTEPPAAMAKALVLNTTRDLGRRGPDYTHGWGLLDAKAAADVVRGVTSNRLLASSSVSQGGSVLHTLTFAHALSLRATLVWTDPAGNPNAANALVNDLDLIAIGPGNVTNRPWIMPFAQSGAPSRTNLATTGVNTKDNVEQIEISCPADGTWQFLVAGTSVPTSPQPYALAVQATQIPDRLEDNETPGTAAPIGAAPGIHLRGLALHCADDVDWYRFDVLRTNSLYVSITGASALTFRVYNDSLALLASNRVPVSGSTPGAPLSAVAPGAYFVQVDAPIPLGTNGGYQLNVLEGVGSPTRVLYVNGPSVTNPAADSYYTTAPGNDANDGLTPATPKATVANVLATYVLGPNDHVVVDSASYPAPFTVTAADAGAAYAGAPGNRSHFTAGAKITLSGADGQILHGFRCTGDTTVDLVGADRNRLEGLGVDASAYGVRIRDDAGNPSISNVLRTSSFSGYGTMVSVEGSPNNVVSGNTFAASGTYGISLVSGWENRVLGNAMTGATYAVRIVDGDREVVEGNLVRAGGAYGVYVDQAVDVVVRGNEVTGRTTAVYGQGAVLDQCDLLVESNTVSAGTYGIYLNGAQTTAAELRFNTVRSFGNYGVYAPANGWINGNDVSGCGDGIRYLGAAMGVFDNRIHNNTQGLAGSGWLGADNWSRPNLVYSNGVGVVSESGAPVRYNRIFRNVTGIAASDYADVHHNLLYENTGRAVLADGKHDVEIFHNTIYAPQGDGVRVQGAAYNTALRNNVIWVQAGYCVSVATDSQRGFSSDYNNLFTTASGKVAWWQKEFADLFDWQTEADLDNHSIGYTAPQPALDNPQFVNAAGGDFHLAAGSTSIDAGRLGDAAGMEPAPNGDRVNLGAYGATTNAELSAASSLTLLYPEYYTDWAPPEGRAIRWTNFNVSGNVDLELYREGAGKVADLAVVAITNGEFAWAPQDNGIVGNVTNRYRIRVTSVTQPLLFDESREPFAIPPTNSDFYVNDGATVNDEYCTEVGDNRNTGKTPADPKAVLQAVLRNYALGPGNVVKTDRGEYLHVRNVIVSATPGVGDDQAFTVTGPTNPARTARWDRGNPYAEATSVDVNGANFVTLTRLTVVGGNRGIWVRNGSANFRGTQLVLASNSLDGLRVESGAAGSQVADVQAFANGSSGIWIGTPIDTLTNCTVHHNGTDGVLLNDAGAARVDNCEAYDNGGSGFYLYYGTTARVQRCRAYRNDRGFSLTYCSAGTWLGHTNLALGLGNRAYSNRAYGVYVYGAGLVAGNTVFGHDGIGDRGLYSQGAVMLRNVVFANYRGLELFSGEVSENRVYGNTEWGLSVAQGTVRRNAIYSSGGGILADDSCCSRQIFLTNNLVYAGGGLAALRLQNVAYGADVVNNTFYQPAGNAVEVASGSQGILLRNNILWVGADYALHVATDSQGGWSSDYNLFFTTNGAKVGYWASADRPTLTAWRNASFSDGNSFAQDPRLVDPDGADGILGAAGASDGRDDDFHERSTQGSFHGGALAPVLDGGTGLPAWLTPAETADGVLSPALDRGDAAYAYAQEPLPNGGFVNLGAYGNTPQASRSPTNYVLVLRPDGGEIWPAAQTFAIRWRSHDTNGTVDIDLLRGGSNVLGIATGTVNDGIYDWLVPALPPAGDYQVRVTRGAVSDTSDGMFSITNAVSIYYVNDGSNHVAGDWTTAAGNEANDGLSPGTPKASVRAVLEAYTVGPGSVIKVDDGVYNLTDTLLIGTNDSGARIEGYYDTNYPGRRALLQRGNFGLPCVDVAGADDVELVRLHVAGGYRGVYARDGAVRLRIEGCTVYSNQYAGIELVDGCVSGVVTGCRVYGLPGGPTQDDQTYGIRVQSDDTRVSGCEIYDHGSYGIQLSDDAGTLNRSVAENNVVYRNGSAGVYLSASSTNPVWVVGNDTYSNGTYGVLAYYTQARVASNRVHGQRDSGDRGIYLVYGAPAAGNEVFDNYLGLSTYGASDVSGNRVYHNSQRGIELTQGASTVRANRVYGNGQGIVLASSPGYSDAILVENNLVYQNPGGAIRVEGSYGGTRVRLNTVYAPAGSNAVQIVGGAQNVSVRNNILWVEAGYALYVANDSQVNLACDYNLFRFGGTGTLGLWGAAPFAEPADWIYETGQDRHSRIGDPLFVDPDGADNVLGYDSLNGVDRGADDDFHELAASPAIDGGDPQAYWLREPYPNGERVNVGAYGNTPEAAVSAAQLVQVLYPNGLEKFELGDAVTVQWRSSGLTSNRWAARINAGGGTVEDWLYDEYGEGLSYTNGFTNAVDTTLVADPAPPTAYRSYRYEGSGSAGADVGWRLPVPDGTYVLRLHFVEPTASGPGQRVFDVRVNGALADDNLDVYATAGARFRAVARTYAATAAGGTGVLVRLRNQTSSAILSGLELTAVNPGGVVTPTADAAFSPDNGGSWGTVATNVAMDTHGRGSVGWTAAPPTAGNAGLMRVTARDGTLPTDQSDRGFLVAGAGTNYYVNDTSTVNDVFCTAPGNNANSGKAPDAPMASLAALLDAYVLTSNDTVYVDTGTYGLLRNVTVAAGDDGVRIEGPVTQAAVLNRGNSADMCVDVNGARDVKLVRLHVTGGYRGIQARNGAARLRVEGCAAYGNQYAGIELMDGCVSGVVTGCRVYGLPGGASQDDQTHGIRVQADDTRVSGCEVFDHGTYGIVLVDETAGTLNRCVAEGNTVYRNGSAGVYANASHTNGNWIVGNDIYSNGTYGVLAYYGMARVASNRVHGQSGSGDAGIYSQYGAPVADNEVWNNYRGITVYGAGEAAGNRVYRNTYRGLELLDHGATARMNRVYANQAGIVGVSSAGYNHRWTIENNLVYQNAAGEIRVDGSSGGTRVANNTVYAPLGNAVEVVGASRNVSVRNNIVWVEAGYALSVANDSQVNLACDYNLFRFGGTGTLGLWGAAPFAEPADWIYETGQDRHSRIGDPLFVDPDGADDVLGYDSVNGVDRGADDDFHELAASPAIDGGDPQAYWLREPYPNGERVNVGAYGNTPEAAVSAAQLVQVLYPNGLEKFELGDAVTVQWRSSGLTSNRWAARINAGGGTVEDWLYDEYFEGSSYTSGFTNAVDTTLVADPVPQMVYRSYRYESSGLAGGDMGWRLAVPDGAYTLRLHFVEPYWTGPGQRVFDVLVNGALADDNLDVYAAAGARFRAVARTYAATAAGGTGVLVRLRNQTSSVMLSGLELTAVNPGGVAAPTADAAFSPDNGGSWGTVATNVALDGHGRGSVGWTAAPPTAGNAGLMRVTARDGTLPTDQSDRGFLVAGAGTNYYVNDTSTVNDVFCSAPGNNANSGKETNAPMASLTALLDAYVLTSNDTVHVDAGTYNLLRNVTVAAGDDGVRIEGPVTQTAALNRGNAAETCVDVAGARDVKLARLHVSGGYRGIHARDGAVRLRVEACTAYGNQYAGIELMDGCVSGVVTGCRVYGLPGGASQDDQTYGIRVQADDTRVSGCEVFDHGTYGIVLVDETASTLNRCAAEGNTVYRNGSAGVYANAYSTNPVWITGNDVYSNGTYGVLAYYGMVRVASNRVHGQGGSGDAGIYSQYGPPVSDNEVWDNYRGITVYGAGEAARNRVYHNSYRGLELLDHGATVRMNRVYANQAGIVGASYAAYNHRWTIENNLVYQNAAEEIRLEGTVGGTRVINNTVADTVGDALQVVGASRDVTVRNNILWTDAGYALYVGVDSQTGFDADYNVFHNLAGPSARVGFWNGSNQVSLAAWQAASGKDAHSQFADPLFVDPNGADDVLGYSTAGGNVYDGGPDDNFQLQKYAPPIDRAFTWSAPPTDLLGQPRHDDPALANSVPGAYGVSNLGASLFATGGVAKSWRHSQTYWAWTLPFGFPFYGSVYSSAYVSTEGFLQFADYAGAADPNNDPSALAAALRIAPLWDNLRTDQTGDDIFVDTSVVGRVTVRWNATGETAPYGDVHGAVTLYSNGLIRFHYGDGNTNLTPTVGLSRGNGADVLLAAYDGASNLALAASLEFFPTNGYADIGAFEFQGGSEDFAPPQVTGSVPAAVHAAGAWGNPLGQIALAVTKPLDAVEAANGAVYRLRRDADGNLVFDGNDVLEDLTPSYTPLSTTVVLTAQAGLLPTGVYQLAILNGTLHDVSGNALDGDADATPGGDYLRVFTLNNHGLAASAPAVVVPENGQATFGVALREAPAGSVTVTVARVSGDGDVSVVSGGTLLFGPGNWAVTQTVTAAAADDVDLLDGAALLRASAPGWDPAEVAATEADDDDHVYVSTNLLVVPEGSNAAFLVRLGGQPAAPVTVTVVRASGDADLAVAGTSSFVFASGDWNTMRTVTVTAAQDSDPADDAAPFIASAPGLAPGLVAVQSADDDRRILVTPSLVVAPEGATAAFTVSLPVQPSTSLLVQIARASGDVDLSASTSSLFFSSDNGTTWQTVRVAAAEDADALNGMARFTGTAADWQAATVTAYEAENDGPPCVPPGTNNWQDIHFVCLGLANADAVVNRPMNLFYDTIQDGLDTNGSLATRTAASNLVGAGEANPALPDDARFPADTNHVFPVQLDWDNELSGNNAVRLAGPGGFAFPVPTGRFDRLHLFATSAGGDSTVAVTVAYASGAPDAVTNLVVDDTFDDGAQLAAPPAGVARYALVDGLDRFHNSAGGVNSYNDPAIFGHVLPLDVTRQALTVTVSKATGGILNAFGASVFRQLSIVTTSLPPGAVGSAYSAALAATGGVPPYAWRALPGAYAETQEPSTFVSNGVAKGWQADSGWWPLPLPFVFPFYGGSYTQCFVDSDGRVRFDFGQVDYTPTLAELSNGVMIATLWADLDTRAPGDIRVWTNGSEVTVYWDAKYFGSSKVHGSVTLQSNGTIRLKYGPGNAGGGFIGISGGPGSNYLVSARSQSGSMSNANDLVFAQTSLLPAGLVCSTNGVLSGVPAAATTSVVSFVVTDASGGSVTAALPIAVTSMPVGDTDGDGMPDGWEILYGLNPVVSNPPTANADGDPFPDIQEYIADTNPTNPASFLQMVQVNRQSTQVVQVVLAPASTGRVYDIRWSTNMPAGFWTLLVTNMPGTGSNLVIAVSNEIIRSRAVRGEVRLP